MPDGEDKSPADVAVEDPDRIDSKCHESPIDADGPTDETCPEDAVSFAFRPSGHRVYLCREHAEALNRFGDDAFGGSTVPTIVDCKRCFLPTLKGRVNYDKICEDCQVD